MAMILTVVQVRVLGALIEKSLAHPAYYPMTINALVAASNQKNNREPIMELSEGDVSTALHELQQWQLVSQAPPEPGARANRFRHETEKRFGWNAPQRAIMAELMVRGPQTSAELKNNASRLTRLEAMDYVRETIGELQRCDPPMVVELARQTGQREARVAHLLCGPVAAAVEERPAWRPEAAPSRPAQDAMEEGERIGRLEAEVAQLREEFRQFRERLGGG